MPEELIPGYELIEKIREGATATTWKARRTFPARTVTLKVLHCGDTAGDRAMLEQILAQTKNAARLQHHGLVGIIDVGTHGGLHYIVTEHTDSPSLADRIGERAGVGDKQAIDIAAQCAKALGYAWTEGRMFHGNLKPGNILVDSNGGVTISDLGLTVKGAVADEASGETREILLGTPNYMSPEQVRGMPDLDCRTDIYSLGATLYHVVTGRMPFDDTPGEAAMYRHLKDRVPNPRQVRPDVSVGLAWLITKMVMKDRDDRYASWAAVSADIKQIAAGRIIVMKEGGAAGSTVEPPKDTVAAAVRRARGGRSPLLLVLRALKWAAILVLWALVGYEVFRLP